MVVVAISTHSIGYITLGMKEHMGACFRDVFSLQSDMFKYICNLGMCVHMHAHARACLCSCMHAHAYMGMCACICLCVRARVRTHTCVLDACRYVCVYVCVGMNE
jgi:hypothetical protein